MSKKLVFDYYYGKEADQFSFYRIPRMLIKDKCFSTLSNDAKILYGLMLDRMSLSLKNEWQDEEDRTYIIYTIDNIMEDLNCSKTKAIRVIGELDSKDGIGLIERVRRGLGKPDIIYVKNFIGFEIVHDDENVDNFSDTDNEKKAEKPHKHTEVSKMDFKKSQNDTSRSNENRPQGVSIVDLRGYENETSGCSESGLQEVSEVDANYTDNNYTENSHNDFNNTDFNYIDCNHPIHLSREDGYCGNRPQKEPDVMEEMEEVRQYMKDIIEYNALIERYPLHVETINQILELMVETITSKAKTIRIGGQDMPQVVVRSRFEKFDMGIMEYALDTLAKNTTKVRNIRAYLLTTLYNAPLTIDSYYRAEVNYDMTHRFI